MGKDGQPTEQWRRYFEAVTTQLGGQGGDQIDDMRFLAEADLSREIADMQAQIAELRSRSEAPTFDSELDEIRQELASLRAATDDGASGVQGAREEAQTLLAQIRGQIDEAVQFARPSGSLADRDDVGRREIALSAYSGQLASNLSVSSTSYVVVAGASLPNTKETTLVWPTRANAAFQSPAASADTAVGQWALYLSDTEIAANSAISGATSSRKIWEGTSSGLTFTTLGSVVVDANDLQTAFDVESGKLTITPFVAGQTFTGQAYVYLCLKVTSGGAESIKIASGSATRIDAVPL